MILSMTGYGRSIFAYKDTSYLVEIKALNAKSSDIRCRLPTFLTEREMQIRKIITDEINRGRVEFTISAGDDNNSNEYNINLDLLMSYYQQLKSLDGKLKLSDGELFTAIMRIPSVTQSFSEQIDDEIFEGIEKAIKQATEALTKFRTDEGKILAIDLKERVNQIVAKLENVKLFEEARITKIKDRIKKNLDEFITSERIDVNRFEQEILYYLEKMDITEEKVRLQQHCNYFIELLTNDDPKVGRILSFLAQEMGREINTLGSKAQDSDIQQIIVVMKDELEKIKEQLANIL